mgnify:CR=1 FL=1
MDLKRTGYTISRSRTINGLKTISVFLGDVFPTFASVVVETIGCVVVLLTLELNQTVYTISWRRKKGKPEIVNFVAVDVINTVCCCCC